MSFGSKVSPAQMKFARDMERAGVASISQIVKAFERKEESKIQEFIKRYNEIRAQKSQQQK